jgi:hypothetical protein
MTSEDQAPLFWNPRKFLDYWFVDMSRLLDGHMRSPVFLDWLRHSTIVLSQLGAQRGNPGRSEPQAPRGRVAPPRTH